MLIIDIHSHLGDILYPGGKELIGRKNVVIEKMWDPMDTYEKGMNRTWGLGSLSYQLTEYWATKAQRARNFTATLENNQRSLDEAGVAYTVALPIAPNLTFEDLARAHAEEPRILPFTSIDFTSVHDVVSKLALDVEQGAMGLKLHPVIQSVSLTDPRTINALQSFASLKKPVLIHAGTSRYYLGKEMDRNVPEFGKIHYLEQVVKEFPHINFIAGHAGLFQVHQLCRRLKGCPNVWVDTSFQSAANIRKLVKTFGPDKVMYGSDWPWGTRAPHIQIAQSACRGDKSLEEMIMGKNAAALLGMKV